MVNGTLMVTGTRGQQNYGHSGFERSCERDNFRVNRQAPDFH
jgi:hypothetical protein